MSTAKQNRLIFIEKTGHTYQQKEQEVADKLLGLVKEWEEERICLSSPARYPVLTVPDRILSDRIAPI